MNVTFGAARTGYFGAWWPVALVLMHGNEVCLGISGTLDCARDLGAAERTLANLAAEFEVADVRRLRECSIELQAHCRGVIKWKPASEFKRDRPRRKKLRRVG